MVIHLGHCDEHSSAGKKRHEFCEHGISSRRTSDDFHLCSVIIKWKVDRAETQIGRSDSQERESGCLPCSLKMLNPENSTGNCLPTWLRVCCQSGGSQEWKFRQNYLDISLNHKRGLGMSNSEEPTAAGDPRFDIGRREFVKMALGGAALLPLASSDSAKLFPIPPGIKIGTYAQNPTEENMLYLKELGGEMD